MGILFDFSTPDVWVTKLHEGIANFRVVGAESKTSQAGNEMIVADMEVTDNQGYSEQLKEYFVLQEVSKWKIKVFLLSVGDFESSKREISEQDFIDKSGKCILKVAPPNDKKPDEKRMKISEYLADPQYDELRLKGVNANIGTPVTPKQETARVNELIDLNDDVPF